MTTIQILCGSCDEEIRGEFIRCPDCGKPCHPDCMITSPDDLSKPRCDECQDKHCKTLDIRQLDNEGRLILANYRLRDLISACYLLEQCNFSIIDETDQRFADEQKAFREKVANLLHEADSMMIAQLHARYEGYEDWD